MINNTKVIHLTSVHPPFDTRIFYKECRTLAQAGYEVVLVVTHDKNDVIDGVRIRAVPKPKNRRERMTKTVRQVYKAAVAENADIYHFHDPELLVVGKFLQLRGKRVIYDMHENLPKAIRTKPWINARLRPLVASLVRFIERILMKGMPVIYAEKSYAKDYKWVKTAVTVLNMPMVSNLLAINEAKYPMPTIGYLGGVSPLRGSLECVEALRILKERGYSVGWECIGPISDYHRSELMRLISSYGLHDVYIRGYMLPDEGWRYIAWCHIGLAILKPIPNYIESYPTKMFEYMALGLPVVTSNFKLYRDIIEKERCGICVTPESPIDIANAIEYLLTHPDEAEAMGKRGQEAVRKLYNWEIESKKLRAFYEKILTGKGADVSGHF